MAQQVLWTCDVCREVTPPDEIDKVCLGGGTRWIDVCTPCRGRTTIAQADAILRGEVEGEARKAKRRQTADVENDG